MSHGTGWDMSIDDRIESNAWTPVDSSEDRTIDSSGTTGRDGRRVTEMDRLERWHTERG